MSHTAVVRICSRCGGWRLCSAVHAMLMWVIFGVCVGVLVDVSWSAHSFEHARALELCW